MKLVTYKFDVWGNFVSLSSTHTHTVKIPWWLENSDMLINCLLELCLFLWILCDIVFVCVFFLWQQSPVALVCARERWYCYTSAQSFVEKMTPNSQAPVSPSLMGDSKLCRKLDSVQLLTGINDMCSLFLTPSSHSPPQHFSYKMESESYWRYFPPTEERHKNEWWQYHCCNRVDVIGFTCRGKSLQSWRCRKWLLRANGGANV